MRRFPSRCGFALLCLLLLTPPLPAETPAPRPEAEVMKLLDLLREPVERGTGLPWLEGLRVRTTDPAGMAAGIREEVLLTLTGLGPEHPDSFRHRVARAVAESLARRTSVLYVHSGREILYLAGAAEESTTAGERRRDLLARLAREAVRAVDDAAFDFDRMIEECPPGEGAGALLLVREGRVEHFGRAAAAFLGVPESRRPPVPGLDPFLVEAGRRFVAALEKREPGLATRAMREPPRSTAVVFHPDRYGHPPPASRLIPALSRSLPGAKVSPQSELALRLGHSAAGIAETDAAFSGLHEAAGAVLPDGHEVRLYRHETDEQARAFLAVRAGVLQLGPPDEDGWTEGELGREDGGLLYVALLARGTVVVEARGPAPETVRLLARARY